MNSKTAPGNKCLQIPPQSVADFRPKLLTDRFLGVNGKLPNFSANL